MLFDCAAKCVFASRIGYESIYELFVKPVNVFFNGPKSTFSYREALCGDGWWNQSLCLATAGEPTVGKYFFDTPTATAVSQTPNRDHLVSFWQPLYTIDPTDESRNCGEYYCGKWPGIGIYADPVSGGDNPVTMSLVFHEALHGITGKDDSSIQGSLSIRKQIDSQNISEYIRENVLLMCQHY